MNKNRVAVFPGSFDPITLGHLDIIKRSADFFEKIIILATNNKNKNHMFSLEERKHMIKLALEDEDFFEKKIIIDSLENELVVNYMKKNNYYFLLRGLRIVSDFEFELRMAQINKTLNKEIETFFLPCNEKTSSYSSSIVKEIMQYTKNLEKFLPKKVNDYINK